MKKTYDWSLRLWVTITNSQRKIQIVASAHTNIHQLKIQIAKILKLPILDTTIDIFSRGKILKSTSTLLQNDIKNDEHLSATVVRTKPAVQLPIQSKKQESMFATKQKKQKRVENVGLTIVSSCTSQKCVNNNQKVEINHGYGNFNILALTAYAKCEVCPYKSQFLRPNMMCHQVKVERCYYQLKGTSLNSCGIPVPHQTGYLKAKDSKEIQKLLEENPWHIDMVLSVKPL